MWTGSLTPLLWIGRIFSVYGPIAGVGGLSALAYGLFAHQMHGAAGALSAVGLIHGVVFTGVGQWALHMRRKVLRLAPPEVVRERYGLEPAALQQLAAERNVRPQLILNGEPYYEPADVVEALSLLRASSAAQAAPDSLLRAAGGAGVPRQDALLRASGEPHSVHDEAARTAASEYQAATLDLKRFEASHRPANGSQDVQVSNAVHRGPAG